MAASCHKFINKFSNTISRTLIRVLVDFLIAVPALVIILPAAIVAKFIRPRNINRKPDLIFGALPIKSLSYTMAALRTAGYSGLVVASEIYPTSSTADFDKILAFPEIKFIFFRHVVESICKFFIFTEALFKTDIFHYFFDGGLLRKTALERFEPWLLKLASKRLVLFPYGSDAYVYDNIEDHSWRHALQIENGIHGRRAGRIESRIRSWCNAADIVIGSIAHIENLPRWDVLPVLWYPIDTESFNVSLPRASGTVRICHAPNHRGAKGTEFLISAIDTMRLDGIEIEFDLIEEEDNETVLNRFAQADIIVDQLLTGYALTALEGLAMGKIVISGLGGQRHQVFRRYSYLDECPIVAASPESIESVLRNLIVDRSRWPSLGEDGRRYATRRHSYAACVSMWDAIYDQIWRGEDSIKLINLFHPLREALWLAQKPKSTGHEDSSSS